MHPPPITRVWKLVLCFLGPGLGEFMMDSGHKGALSRINNYGSFYLRVRSVLSDAYHAAVTAKPEKRSNTRSVKDSKSSTGQLSENRKSSVYKIREGQILPLRIFLKIILCPAGLILIILTWFILNLRYALFALLVCSTLPCLLINLISWIYCHHICLHRSYREFVFFHCREPLRKSESEKKFGCCSFPQKAVDKDGYQTFTSVAEWRDELARSIVTSPYTFKNKFIDRLFSWYIWSIDTKLRLGSKLLISSRPNKFEDQEKHYRQYLSRCLPPFPIASYDYVFLQDSLETPCNIVVLLITERLSFKDFRHFNFLRYALTDAKFRSTLGIVGGRLCWIPMMISADQIHANADELDEQMRLQREVPDATRGLAVDTDGKLTMNPRPIFNIDDHVFERSLDLRTKTIYQAASEIASEELPRNRALWRTYLFQPVNEDVFVHIPKYSDRCNRSPTLLKDIKTSQDGSERFVDASDSEDLSSQYEKVRASELSFFVNSAHHSISDGVSICMAFGNTLDPFKEDEKEVKMKFSEDFRAPFILPHVDYAVPFNEVRVDNEVDKRAGSDVSGWKVVCYILLNMIKGLGESLAELWLWSLCVPKGISLFGSTPRILQSTGRKHLAAPVQFSVKRVTHLCRDLGRLLDGEKFTLNDVFTYCLSAGLSRLEDPDMSQKIINHFKATDRMRSRCLLDRVQDHQYFLECDPPETIEEGLKTSKFSFESSLSCPEESKKSVNKRLLREKDGDDSSEKVSAEHSVPQPGTGSDLSTRYDDQFDDKFYDEMLALPDHPNLKYTSSNKVGDVIRFLLPVSTRFSVPTGLDNFTSLAMVQVPGSKAIDDQFDREAGGGGSKWQRFLNHLAMARSGVDLKKHVETIRRSGDAGELLRRLRHLFSVQAILHDLKRRNVRVKNFGFFCLAVMCEPQCISKAWGDLLVGKGQVRYSVFGPHN